MRMFSKGKTETKIVKMPDRVVVALQEYDKYGLRMLAHYFHTLTKWSNSIRNSLGIKARFCTCSGSETKRLINFCLQKRKEWISQSVKN